MTNAEFRMTNATAAAPRGLPGDLWIDEVAYWTDPERGAAYGQRWMEEAEEQLRGYVESFLKAGHQLAAFVLPDGQVQCGWRHVRRRFRDIWGHPQASPLEALRSATKEFDRIYRAGTDSDYTLVLWPPPGSKPFGQHSFLPGS